MCKLVSIDPSLRGTGIAWWMDGELVDVTLESVRGATTRRAWGKCGREIAASLETSSHWPQDVVCEIPQIYKQSPGDPNDLVAVTLVAGALCARFTDANITTVVPSEWKGQVPKSAHHPRIMRALREPEKAILDIAQRKAGEAFHNVMDAVGLGLWYLNKNGQRAR